MNKKTVLAFGMAMTLTTGALTAPLQALAQETTMIDINDQSVAVVPGEAIGSDQDVRLQAVKIVHDASGEIIAVESLAAAELPASGTASNASDWSIGGGFAPETAQLTMSINAGYPFGSYGTLGVIVGNGGCITDFAFGCYVEGLLIEGSLAQFGQMLSVGWERRVVAITFLGSGEASLAGKLTAFRTNGNSELAADQIYIGPQVEASYMLGRLSAGFLGRVSGAQGPVVLPTVSFGLGF